MQPYSFKTTASKGIKYLVIFAIPFIIAQFKAIYPELADMTLLDILKALIPEFYLKLTISAVLVMAANWLKVKIGLRLP